MCKFHKVCILEDASNCVESVIASQPVTAVLSTPLPNNRRKRTLSAPSVGESVNKKMKNISPRSPVNLGSDSENAKVSSENKTEKRTRLAARRKLQDAESSETETNKKNKTSVIKGVKKSLKALKGRQNTSKIEKKPPGKTRRNMKQLDEGEQTKNQLKTDSKSVDTDLSAVLNAVTDMRQSLETKIDVIDKTNKAAIDKMQTQFDTIRSEFNQRMEGLAKKVETRIKKMMDTEIDRKVRSEIKRESEKAHKMIQKNEKDIRRLEESVVATVKEDIGDEIDSLVERVKSLESSVRQDNNVNSDEALRKRRIVIKNLEEREHENLKQRVENILDYLKLRDINIESTERKNSKHTSEPGIVIATLHSVEERARVLNAKKALRHSNRFRNVYVEPDIPGYHRKINSNLHTIVGALGKEKLHFKGSRVYVSEQDENNHRNDREYEHSQYERNRGHRDHSINNRDYSRSYHRDDERYDKTRTGYDQKQHRYHNSGRNYSNSVRPRNSRY